MLGLASYLLGLAGTAVGCAAAAAFLELIPGSTIARALVLHAVSVTLVAVAARLRGAKRGVELDAVVVIATFVPVIGPALAWTFPSRESKDGVANAHAVFESYEEATKSKKPSYRPAIFTGNFEKDLSREINTVSYAEVLRRGTLEQKRNLLRTLGRRATLRDLEMIRQCLFDDEQEIRLCAYAEIDRLSRNHEAEVAKLKTECEPRKDGSSASEEQLVNLAEAQLNYACSGIMDEEMAKFWLMEAEKTADAALALNAADWRAVRTKAKCKSESKDYEGAKHCLDNLSSPKGDRPEIWLARAEVAFRTRDFSTARKQANKLRSKRLQLPPWLSALGQETTTHEEAFQWDA